MSEYCGIKQTRIYKNPLGPDYQVQVHVSVLSRGASDLNVRLHNRHLISRNCTG